MNKMNLHRFNGTESFPIASAKMFTVGEAGDLTLWFEVEAGRDGAILNSDTSEYPRVPSAELGIKVSDFDPHGAVGRQFHHPGTENDDEDSCDALFYYFEHEPLRDNKLIILEQPAENVFLVRWSARTQDVNHYDGSKPDARLEIEAEFSFTD